jgi:hypothetical protein
MDKPTQKCMVCAKPTEVLKGGEFANPAKTAFAGKPGANKAELVSRRSRVSAPWRHTIEERALRVSHLPLASIKAIGESLFMRR